MGPTMSDSQPEILAAEPVKRRLPGQTVTLAAAFFVLLLAVGAVLWPAGNNDSLCGVVLVFDPTGDVQRIDALYRPLAGFLAVASGHGMELEVARDKAGFLAAAARGVDFIFCPDGLALKLGVDSYEPLVAGRRAAPRNLRPRSVLVYRKSVGMVEQPWLTRPSRTVFGDSLSLVAIGTLLSLNGPVPDACSWGPDPYDHSPVLHAARLGSFDFACVRQWDAERFFTAGLLSRTQWGEETLTVPVPDFVLLASRQIPGHLRLDVRETLSGFARTDEPTTEEGEALGRGLSLLRLVGFNILLEPDFDRVRGIFKGHWQAVGD